jgi:hypothetical protein
MTNIGAPIRTISIPRFVKNSTKSFDVNASFHFVQEDSLLPCCTEHGIKKA